MIGRFKVLRYGYANDDWTARVNRMIKNSKRKQERNERNGLFLMFPIKKLSNVADTFKTS